jgi:eukaryotic-like serine/threonine-protein kinase
MRGVELRGSGPTTSRRVGGQRRTWSQFPLRTSAADSSSLVEGHPVIHRDQTAVSQFAASELKAGELVAGRYRIEALLGVGGMGVVYRARDEQLGVDVALKLLRPEMASRPEAFERFRQELLMARQVSSPHVVRIHDLVADGDRRWLISMDFVPGRSLEQRLDAERMLDPQEAVSICRQVALGLAAAHASDIVHRDLKPANILLRDDGHACISDFGVARSAGAVRATSTGMLIGTPDYLSPEQARGEDVGPRSDLYALGLILYEMLAGQRPFEATTAAESLAQRQFKRPPPLRKLRAGIPPWLERLTERLLDPHPLRRLRDADAVVAAIDAQKVARRLPRPAVLLATAGLLAAVGGGAWLWQRGVSVSVAPTQAVAALDVAVLPVRVEDAAVSGAATSSAQTSSAQTSSAQTSSAQTSSAQTSSADTAAGKELALAYSDLITSALLAGDAVVADRRRVDHALARLGYDRDSALRHPQRVLAETGAKRILDITLRQDGDKVALRFALSDASGAAPRVARTAAVGPEALAPAIRTALAELGLSRASDDLGTLWPRSADAARAYGRGLAQTVGPEAIASYDTALKSEPRFVAVWWQRLLTARRWLPETELAAAATAAREALRGARGRDVERTLALIALIEGNPQLAVERLAPLASADPHDMQTRLLYAEALEASGDRAASEAELGRMTSLDPQNAATWLLRGQSAIRAGEAQRAVDDYLLRARVLYTRIGDEFGRADTLNALGLGFDMLGQSPAAIDYFTQAAKLRERLGHGRGAAGSYLNLAWAQAVASDGENAERNLARARELASTLHDNSLLAEIANDAGLIDEERGDFRAALPHFREALRLRESLGDATGVAEAALNLGFALIHTGEFVDAQSHLENAERTYAAAEDRTGMARSLQLLAQVDMARGDLVAADRRLQRALRLVEEVNLADERAVLYAEMAELSRLQGKTEQALEYADRALALFEKQGDKRGGTETRLRIVATHSDRGAWAAAEKILAEIPDDAFGNIEQAALTAAYRSEVALGRDNAQAALRFADGAMRSAIEAHSMPAELRARIARVRALAAVRDTTEGSKELAAVDRLLIAYPAADLKRARDRAAESLRSQPIAKRQPGNIAESQTKDRQ